jgi:signal transduction histidine kinase
MTKKISIKLALIFISILLASSVISFVVSAIISPSFINEIRDNQEEVAYIILELKAKTDLSLDEIIDALRPSLYNIQIEDIDIQESLTDEEMISLARGEFIENHTFRLKQNFLIMQVDDSIIRIGVQPSEAVLFHMISRLWDSFLLYIIIGTFIIIVLVRKVVKPIVNVTEATQEVAKGNFDIELEVKNDDEIGQLMKNFNKMVKELRDIEILRKDFVSNVSHELKTPLASIQGFAKVLRDENLSAEEYNEYLEIIINETSRLTNLSSNLLKISKLESQGIIEVDRFLVDEQIRKAILMLAPVWERKEIEFELDLQDAPITGNEELLNNVWINIISNAIKFSKPKGSIKVKIEEFDYNYLIKISDNGIGMTEETRSRAFEQFFQGEVSHSDVGSGLGLALSQRIIEIHEGTISIESEVSKGTTVIVNLLKEEV